MVCSDIFDNKRFKYLNHKKHRIMKDQNDTNFDSMYCLPQAVLNPFCPKNGNAVVVNNWPQLSDTEIDKLNQSNMTIKEVTLKTREALRIKKEQERLKAPKRV
jgi:hypothetical protein